MKQLFVGQVSLFCAHRLLYHTAKQMHLLLFFIWLSNCWVQSVCKENQQMTKVATSKERDKTDITTMLIQDVGSYMSQCMRFQTTWYV